MKYQRGAAIHKKGFLLHSTLQEEMLLVPTCTALLSSKYHEEIIVKIAKSHGIICQLMFVKRKKIYLTTLSPNSLSSKTNKNIIHTKFWLT